MHRRFGILRRRGQFRQAQSAWASIAEGDENLGAAFDIQPGSDFDVISQTEKRDQAIIGLSVAGALGSNVYARLSYQGRINGDADSHAGGITVAMKLGGK